MKLSENTIIKIETILNDLRNYTYKFSTICHILKIDWHTDLGQEVGNIIAEDNISNYTKISQLKGLK